MYEALINFLRSFSAQYPLPWALLVMAVISGAGLLLYGFWELTLRGASRFLGGPSSRAGAPPASDRPRQ